MMYLIVVYDTLEDTTRPWVEKYATADSRVRLGGGRDDLCSSRPTAISR